MIIYVFDDSDLLKVGHKICFFNIKGEWKEYIITKFEWIETALSDLDCDLEQYQLGEL